MLLSPRVIVLAAAALALTQGAAPPAPQSQQPPPRFRAETNLARVDAYATRDGVPVPGDYVVELSTAKGGDTHKSLVAIRVTP